MLIAYMPNQFADVIVEHLIIAKFIWVDIDIATYHAYAHCTVVLGEGTVSRGGSAASADGPQPNTMTKLQYFPQKRTFQGKESKRTKRGASTLNKCSS